FDQNIGHPCHTIPPVSENGRRPRNFAPAADTRPPSLPTLFLAASPPAARSPEDPWLPPLPYRVGGRPGPWRRLSPKPAETSCRWRRDTRWRVPPDIPTGRELRDIVHRQYALATISTVAHIAARARRPHSASRRCVGSPSGLSAGRACRGHDEKTA